ncbi:DUF177 domain-containing protein [Bengtsoniella intestinalis]|uniref:YceD family protein n=1 Tax=Bengtsoniella intestinalis TaxID=3073143 RepID=UPI00391F2D5D
MDLQDVEHNGYYPIVDPVVVEGVVRNSADVLELSMTMTSDLDVVCDRCTKEFTLVVREPYQVYLAEEVQNEDAENIVVLQDGCVDLEEMARTVFILNLDSKILCSEDCKGLCHQCGADLNLSGCTCKKVTDPRMAALAKLLDK